MAAALGIVRGHRGAIRIISEVGKGTTVTVLLPGAGPEVSLACPASPAGAVARPANAAVLVVDDNARVLQVVSQLVWVLGYQVMTAASGGEALRVFGERHAQIACVLLDLTMPDMDGPGDDAGSSRYRSQGEDRAVERVQRAVGAAPGERGRPHLLLAETVRRGRSEGRDRIGHAGERGISHERGVAREPSESRLCQFGCIGLVWKWTVNAIEKGKKDEKVQLDKCLVWMGAGSPGSPPPTVFHHRCAAANLARGGGFAPELFPGRKPGPVGRSTANALVGNLEFLEAKARKKVTDLSRLFIYYNERALEGTVKEDAGAMIAYGVKTLAKQGVCAGRLWRNKIAKFAVKPRAVCYQQALTHQVQSYHRIITLQDMLTCLAEGYPFVFGFTVYESFESKEVAKTGQLDLPKHGERTLGGHAVMAVGYDDPSKRFVVRTYCGKARGLQGYFTMPYAYLEDRNLADDFWTLRVLENP